MTLGPQTVVVLGAGINGCAVARELALNGVGVWLVDTGDIASGATSGSSRLIHGGLRYLEYGEFALVKESLGERARLLRLAPQFVRPLRLWIPSSNLFGGLLGAVGRFFGWRWWPAFSPKSSRGISLIRAGLSLYDLYARDPQLPNHEVHSVSTPGAPHVDQKKYHWMSSYYDAQVVYPERLVQAMLYDANQAATKSGVPFRVFTYSTVSLSGRTVEVVPSGSLNTSAASTERLKLEPGVIINATGAWVDETLARLHVPAHRLMGGTKGSHAFTFSARLKELLGGQGIYAEADDERPIFITPLADTVLIGTTDEPFNGPPESAVATEEELAYLLRSVNSILPDAKLTPADIDFHYSAVRPLPFVGASSPASITRRHALVKNDDCAVPLYSVVGGKLTTMRSLAETTAETVLAEMQVAKTVTTGDRKIPGAEDYPADTKALEVRQAEVAARVGFSLASVTSVWHLYGTRTEEVLSGSQDRELLPHSPLPCLVARLVIEHEYARTLADLVERRLMLLYHHELSTACLRRLAELLVEAGHLPASDIDTAVAGEIERLAARYGKRTSP